jgi:peptide subunit release factor 1 (eRF1)
MPPPITTRPKKKANSNFLKAAYGEEKTRLALSRGAVELLLISKKLDKAKTQEFEAMANNIGAEVVIISVESPEGEQFLNITKGLGAILRFALE